MKRPSLHPLLRGIGWLSLLMVAGSAAALENLDGHWVPIFHEDVDERLPGPDTGDYLGLPINDAARLRGDTWESSLLTMPEHQCKPHPSTYGFRGIGTLRVWEERDPESQQLTQINTYIVWEAQHRVIWMDGRAHPPAYAPHSWQGFSTGTWDGDVLVVKTTHLKAGWVRRNGLPLSDLATMTDRFIRHGNLMTHIMMIEDPVYLTEPLIKSNEFQWVANGTMDPYPCRSTTEVVRPEGEVPHHSLEDTSPSEEFAAKHKLPVDAARGGAETALPEYQERLRAAAPAAR